MALRKIRIVNDSSTGEPIMTRVYDDETGEQIKNVTRIELLADRDCLRVQLDLVCEVEYEGPAKVRRMRVKEDGTTEPIEDEA